MRIEQRPTLYVSAIVCLLASAVLFGRLGQTPFHGDESGWIASGRYYAGLLATGDFDRTKWECVPCGPWGSLNMPLGKLLIGIPTVFSRQHGFFRLYDFDQSLQQNIARGNVPAAETLLSARAASAVFGILCCLLVFAIGCATWNTWTGFTAAFLLIVDSLFADYATRAMTDVHYNALLLSVVLSTIVMLKSSGPRQMRLVAACTGMLAGLAACVKVTGVVIGGGVFLALLIYEWSLGKTERRSVLHSLIVFAVSALCVIYALNPWFWISFRSVDIDATYRELQSVPREIASGSATSGRLEKRFPQLSNLCRPLEFPRMFLRWRSQMRGQRGSESASWKGNRLVSLNRRVLTEDASFTGEWVFLLVGLSLCAANFGRSFRSGDVALATIPMFFFVINYLFIVIFLELNWQRYYLPTVIASKISVAIGVCEIAKYVYRWTAAHLELTVARDPARDTRRSQS